MRRVTRLRSISAALAVALLYCASARADQRVAVWNIFSVGAPGSVAFEAAADILARVGPDVIGINEVESMANLTALAQATGFPHVFVGTTTSFAGISNAILSRYPLSSATVHTSQSLSGDPLANDLNTHPVSAIVDTPDGPLALVVAHLRASGSDAGEFQRVAEALRLRQIVDSLPPDVAVFVLGDLNQRVDLLPLTPTEFSVLPSGMPAGYSLGTDIALPLQNDPFAPLGLDMLGTPQLAGPGTTSWGGQLDYIFLDAMTTQATGQTYDSADDLLPQAALLSGAPLPAATSDTASDHLLPFADIGVMNAQAQAGTGLAKESLSGGNGCSKGKAEASMQLTLFPNGSFTAALAGGTYMGTAVPRDSQGKKYELLLDAASSAAYSSYLANYASSLCPTPVAILASEVAMFLKRNPRNGAFSLKLKSVSDDSDGRRRKHRLKARGALATVAP